MQAGAWRFWLTRVRVRRRGGRSTRCSSAHNWSLLLLSLLFTPPLLAGTSSAAGGGFDFDDVVARAQKLADKAFEDPQGQVPDWLLKVTYDQWRDIRFRPDRSLWRDRKSNFEVQFFHPGLYYN